MKKTSYILNLIIILSVTGLTFAQNNPVDNQLRLAKSFESRRKLGDAELIYTELYKKQPLNYQFYSLLNKNLIAQKKYDEALSLVETQIKLSRNKVSLFGDKGSIYFLLGREQDARDIWEEALELEPNNAFAFRTIANCLVENRLLEDAIQVLIEGNEVSDDHTIFSYEIANYYSITMKFKEATKEYCKILAQKPKQLTLIKNKIFGYINTNKAENPTINTVLEIYADTENVIFLKLIAELYSRVSKRDKALDTIIEVENLTSKNGSAIFTFAQQSSRVGDHKIAAKAYKQIITNYPNSALISESEIGYTKSLEFSITRKQTSNENWKPLEFEEIVDSAEYNNLIAAYEKLRLKYADNKIGWESEYRIAKILHENLTQYDKAERIYQKIIDEARTLQYIDHSYFGLAKIAIQHENIEFAEKFLIKITESRISKDDLKIKARYFLAKLKMWQGDFSSARENIKIITQNPKNEYVNDALEYSLLLNTFKNDSTNLFSFFNSDYLVEIGNFTHALSKFKQLADNGDLFLLKDIASLRYTEILLALNNYQEAAIFLEEVSNRDEDNIYKDRFLYLLGSNYYYGLNNDKKALSPLTQIFEEFPNSIYFNKARKIISEINAGVENTL